METPPSQNPPLTPAQQRAVDARGNVLVMAGAGTGKTKTLIARCLDCLERERVDLDALLIVTFTEAAAAELRHRLRLQLEEKAAAHPADEHWPKQLALLGVSHLGTLHGFCLQLAREHFYELGLDPRFAVLDEGEAVQRAHETLDDLMQAHYAGDDEFSLAVQNLIQVHGGGRDENSRKLVLRLHEYSQARPNAAGWLAEQRAGFSVAEPVGWQKLLRQAVADWRDEWRPVLTDLQAENVKAAELAKYLSCLPENFSPPEAGAMLEQIADADATANYPKGQAGKLRPALGDIFDEAKFLRSLTGAKAGTDPLAEDWSWVRGQMGALLRLAEEFSGEFARRKLADGVADFHDLEQFALRLLWDFGNSQPTSVAEMWRKKVRFVFVDEYQDINAAQDQIIQALSCATGDRFLVGDVKQSIYRFRLADPEIFRSYARAWHPPAGETIALSENFRSREGLLNFVNSVCGGVMRAEIGGVDYDADAELKFGAPGSRTEFSAVRDVAPRVELFLRQKHGRDKTGEDDERGELADLDETQKEARLVARRLRQLHSTGRDWRDMTILLRSPRGKSEIYAQEFQRAGVPLAVASGGFYASTEILDLLSLLQLLDNPLQDVPCLAVLRSPFVGLSLDELAEIRPAAGGHFWTALNRYHDAGAAGDNPLAAKAARFLARFARWRLQASQQALSPCLEEILDETLYADWLRAQPRGGQRAANVTAFLNLARQFDQFQRQGLLRFLKFIEAQQAAETEPEVSAATGENAVRLMSIHQSKGLEFPVVVLPDLAKNFNEQDLHGEIIFDEDLGLCPKVKPPAQGGRYPSLPHWLAQRRQRRAARGEELRLLYVALTRARDNLVLTAAVSEKNWAAIWKQPQPITPRAIAAARSVADWLAMWFAHNVDAAAADSGETSLLRWRLVGDAELAAETAASADEPAQNKAAVQTPPARDETMEKNLRTRLSWSYPFAAATERSAKSSVTALRRAAEAQDEEAAPLFAPKIARSRLAPAAGSAKPGLSATEIGVAHHKFLQHVALDRVNDLAAEAGRLAREKYLSAAEAAALDLPALANFWNSETGQKICAQAAHVRRELPFTARFSPAEIAVITGVPAADGLSQEFIVVQGVADLAVLRPEEIWLVDFKTDAIGPNDLAERVKIYTPQLRLYSAALEKIFSRPVAWQALHFLAVNQTRKI